MKSDSVKVTLTAKVHPETSAEIRKLAEDDDRTVSYVIRGILERYLANQKEHAGHPLGLGQPIHDMAECSICRALSKAVAA